MAGEELSVKSKMHHSFIEYHNAYNHRMLNWKLDVLFSWQWWLGVVLTILPWIIWGVIRKKEGSSRLLFAGTFVSLTATSLDSIGIQVGAWNYIRPVTPVIPSYLPYDFALLPVIIMLLIQYFPNKNPWVIGFLFGLLTAFVGEPLFRWMEIYEPIYWKHWYSLPIYTVIYTSAHKIAMSNNWNRLN